MIISEKKGQGADSMSTKESGKLIKVTNGTDVDIRQACAQEMDGLDIAYEYVKIPIGGNTNFEIYGGEGSPEVVDKIRAIIIYHHPVNAYYEGDYHGGVNLPLCSSIDGHIGIGTPGGECRYCPANQYGSGKNGAKACKNRHKLFLLREGEFFPMIMTLPPGSLKTFAMYLQQVIPKYGWSNAVVTDFSVERATTKGGVVFSQVQFAVQRALTADEYNDAAIMRTNIMDMVQNPIDAGSENGNGNIIVDRYTGEVIDM